MQNFIDPIDFELLKQDDSLPSPGGVRLNIMRMCRQEDVSLPDLVVQIQADPLLSGRIIKIGNAAGVNKGRPIASINKDILLMIGLQTVRQLALAVSLTTERKLESCSGFDYQRFWARTVAMACAGQALAQYYGEAPPGEMFASGLLANIGQLGLAATKTATYAKLLVSHTDDKALTAAEKASFGFNHRELAAAMMQDWEIPLLFCDAVLHHSYPEESGLDSESRILRLAQMLHMASAIAEYCVATDDERLPALRTVLDAGKPLHSEIAHVTALCDRVTRDWVEWGAMVKIHVQHLPPAREVMQQLLDHV